MFSFILFYTLMWLIIAGFEKKALFFGVIAIIFTLLVHRLLNLYLPSINLLAIAKFFFYFLGQSFLSGLDVARRVLSPKLLVDPGFVIYKLNTNKQVVKFLLSMVINLTPGTLSVEIGEDTILIHTLDKNSYDEEKYRGKPEAVMELAKRCPWGRGLSNMEIEIVSKWLAGKE